MKRYKLEIGSPVYKEVYQYSTRSSKKVVKDECRKHLILRFTARVFEKTAAEQVLHKLIADFAVLAGCTEVIDLESVSWGEPSTFDEDNYIFKGAFCIPKDFDCLTEQKAFIGQKCKEYERALNEAASLISCPAAK